MLLMKDLSGSIKYPIKTADELESLISKMDEEGFFLINLTPVKKDEFVAYFWNRKEHFGGSERDVLMKIGHELSLKRTSLFPSPAQKPEGVQYTLVSTDPALANYDQTVDIIRSMMK